MANQDFVEIISDKAIGNIATANAELGKLLQTLNVTVTTANKLNLAGSSGKPSQSNANTAANNAAIERNIKAIERQRLAEIKLMQEREKAFDKYERQLNRETAKLQAAKSLQAKTASQIKVLDAAYTELATKKARYNSLTEAEEKRLNTLTATLQKYRSIQDGVNVTVGKFQQRVGQYERGASPLAASINQVSRELPALAVNTQTFFLAISNNLPAVFDAYTNIIAQNKTLVAQGQPTQSFFKQLVGSLFSLQSALSIGITLLTLFGGEIVDAIFNTKEKAEADKKAKEAVDAKTRAEEEYNNIMRQSSAEEISRSKLLLENAKNVNIEMSDRLQYISELRERYPDYLNKLSDEEILAGKTAEAELRLNDALLKRGIAIALQDKIGKAYAKLTDELIKYQEIQKRGITSGNVPAPSGDDEAMSRLISRERKLGDQRLKNSLDNQKNIKSEIQALIDLYNEYSPYLDVVKESGTANSKAAEQIQQAETNSRVAFERTISSLEEKLSLMSQENSSYGILQGQLKLVKGAYEALYGAQEGSNEQTEKTIKYGTAEYFQDVINKLSKERDSLADTTEEYELYNQMIARSQEQLDKLTGKTKDIERLNDEVQKYLKSFSEGFLSEAKLGSFNMFLSLDENGQSPFDKLLEQADTAQERFAITFNAIAETAQEAFSFITQNQQAAFDQMYANLDREKELRLQYVGDNESARAEIERQYEEKRREIRRRELQAQKEQALFNIALNTAQGITAALASVPPNVPLSIVIGAIGAAQLALVASRQIPAYKMGTDNHAGGLAIVGDGGKHEVVHQPTLGWSITPAKDTLVNLEKGSKVFPDLASSGIFNSDLPDMVQLNSQGLTVSQMDRIMAKYHAAQAPYINIDKNGINTYTRGLLSKTQKLDNIVKFQGRKK